MRITFPLAILAIHAQADTFDILTSLGLWKYTKRAVNIECKGPRRSCLLNCGAKDEEMPDVNKMKDCISDDSDEHRPLGEACKKLLTCEIDRVNKLEKAGHRALQWRFIDCAEEPMLCTDEELDILGITWH